MAGLTYSEAKSLMREAVRLNNALQAVNRSRAASGMEPVSPSQDQVDALETLAESGYNFDPSQYDHPSDV